MRNPSFLRSAALVLAAGTLHCGEPRPTPVTILAGGVQDSCSRIFESCRGHVIANIEPCNDLGQKFADAKCLSKETSCAKTAAAAIKECIEAQSQCYSEQSAAVNICSQGCEDIRIAAATICNDTFRASRTECDTKATEVARSCAELRRGANDACTIAPTTARDICTDTSETNRLDCRRDSELGRIACNRACTDEVCDAECSHQQNLGNQTCDILARRTSEACWETYSDARRDCESQSDGVHDECIRNFGDPSCFDRADIAHFTCDTQSYRNQSACQRACSPVEPNPCDYRCGADDSKGGADASACANEKAACIAAEYSQAQAICDEKANTALADCASTADKCQSK